MSPGILARVMTTSGVSLQLAYNVGDQLVTRNILKQSDGFKIGQTASKRAGQL